MKSKIIKIALVSAIISVSFSACKNSSSTTSETESTVSESTSPQESTSDDGNSQTTTDNADGNEKGMGDGNMPSGGMTGGAIDKSSDTELQSLITDVEGKFQQFEYTDKETGYTVPYNLYIPEDYDDSKSYPLVLFIADSSVVGQDTTAPLTQGYGGLVWASEEEQAKHASFVLVPEYPEVIIDDHDSFTTTDYIELTKRMLESVMSEYNLDNSQIYGTGQSMGCMTIMYLSAKYPELFTAELFISGQWDISELEPLADQKFFYIAAAGDDKASVGQTEVESMLDKASVSYSAAQWDATWSGEEFDTAVASILSGGNNINIATFKLGTVLPEGVEVGTSEHMYSFDYAYKIEAVRDWLFSQTR